MNFGEVLGSFGTGLAQMFVDIAEIIIGLFFTVTEAGAITIQPIGYISMLGLVITIVFFVFKWISGLFNKKR